MNKYLLILFTSALLMGCGSTKTMVEVVERTTHDTLYYNKVQYDSIYRNDSFLMDYHRDQRWDQLMVTDGEIHKPLTINHKPLVDTMYIHDKQLEYKYKYLHDTCYVHQVDTIPIVHQVEVVKTERYVPAIYKWSLGFCILLVIITIIVLIWKIRF